MPLPSGSLLPSPGLLPGPSDGSTPPSAPPPPDPVYRIEITDLYGTVLDTLENYSELEVVVPIGDDRSGKVTLSVYDPSVQHLTFISASGHLVSVLGRMLRVKYRTKTLLWGIVTRFVASTDNSTVQLDLSGPSVKLKHRELNYSDSTIVSPENGTPIPQPADWTTVEAIVEAAYDTPAQYGENIPDVGIVVENVDAPNAPGGLEIELDRGTVNWDAITQITEGAYGGEFDMEPYDPTDAELPFDTTRTVTVVP